jgi:hypothetical protein
MQAETHAHAHTATALSWPQRFVRNVAIQDWLVVGYFFILLGAVLVGKGPRWGVSLQTVITDLAIFTLAILLVRGEILKQDGYLAGLVYRAGIFGPPFLSYFQLRWVLPTVTQRALDADIYAFDMRVFHYEPSVAWDKWVSPTTVEWFAFFYALYFLIVALHVLPWLLFGKDSTLFRAFGIGTLVVFLTAHITYMIVPGYGPYQHLGFQNQLAGGRFWKLVLDAVHEDGALKDIFPSLHTAAPSFLLFFSIANRKTIPFKYTWPPLAFLVSQIVIATMFLRWHYLVDIVAGLLLALVAVPIGAKVARWEVARRERLGLQTIFGVAPLHFLGRGLLGNR